MRLFCNLMFVAAAVGASNDAFSQTTLSYDPTNAAQCARVIEWKPSSQDTDWIGAACPITQGNTIHITGPGIWTRNLTWTNGIEANLPCDRVFVDFNHQQAGTEFMYGQAKDCSSTNPNVYGNFAHAQLSPSFAGSSHPKGFPNDLYLYDSNHPNGYKLLAKIAATQLATNGSFVRIALVFHLYKASTGSNDPAEDLFVEFDAYNSGTLNGCTKGGMQFTVCPTNYINAAGKTFLFERYQFWGSNMPTDTWWHEISVESADVGQIIGRFRPDLPQASLRVVQVYTTMELKGSTSVPAFGQLQTKELRFQAL